MNHDKLEALRRLAADERTPIEEARNAALAYVRAGGVAPVGDDHVPRSRLDEVERELVRTRDALARAEKHRAESARLRSIIARLVDASKAEELAAKVRADAQKEAREALDGEEVHVVSGHPVRRRDTTDAPRVTVPGWSGDPPWWMNDP